MSSNQAKATEASAKARRARRADFIEDIEWMLGNGESHAAIVERIGPSATAIARRLYRAERPDLAAAFERLYKQSRRHPCADCGHLVWPDSTRCKQCEPIARTPNPQRTAA